MAPVYREIEMEWNGKTYNVKPTYQFIQHIEQRLSLASLIESTLAGRPRLSQMADLLAACLRAAGCKDEDATAENINAELYSDENENALALTSAATQILFALVPQRAPRGNVPAPGAGADEAGADKSKTSTGGNTTKLPSGT